ncbi:histidinol dehydrogenase, chloroplastic isoform X1 [Tanacetum coccineum]
MKETKQVQDPLIQRQYDENLYGQEVDGGLRTQVIDEVKKQIGLAGPLIAVSLLQYCLEVISIMFVGHLGELPLSSASMATSFASFTGFSVLVLEEEGKATAIAFDEIDKAFCRIPSLEPEVVHAQKLLQHIKGKKKVGVVVQRAWRQTECSVNGERNEQNVLSLQGFVKRLRLLAPIGEMTCYMYKLRKKNHESKNSKIFKVFQIPSLHNLCNYTRKLLFSARRSFLPVRLSTTVTCAMKSYKLSDLTPTEVDNLKARPRIDFSSIFSTVQPIVDDVRNRGDAAVKESVLIFSSVFTFIMVNNGLAFIEYYCSIQMMFDVFCSYTLRFDKVELEKIIENVSDLPDPELDEAVRESFDVAYSNIYAFHAAQKPVEKVVENMEGVRCKRVARSISSVGLYVPGGTAVLPSTALMLAIPAQIAGCKTVVLATPPSSDGSICKEVLYCAKKAGVTHILKAGGAQAISAMAWGTASCPKAEKIYGPGNQYVTAAKMILQNSEAMVSIDMPAGPSEVLVIADKYASPVHIAADLLSQAEHGPDSQVVLVIAGDGVDINAIEEEITKQCNSLPRGEFALKALSHSFTVFARDMVEAVAFSNLYAPEHLIINVKDAEKWENFIENAGSVFLGQWTPESVGDYASGTNHVLPTYGYARMYSGVSLDSFLKYITIQSLTEEGLAKLGPHVATMAEVEGLDAHKRAVTLRLQDIKARQAA